MNFEPALNYSSVFFWSTFLIQCTAFAYLLSLRRKSADVRLFAVCQLCLALNAVSWVGFATFFDTWTKWFYFLGFGGGILHCYFFGRFAYAFHPVEAMQAEARRFAWLGLGVVAVPTLSLSLDFLTLQPQLVVSRETFGFLPNHTFRLLSTHVVALVLWSVVVLVRKSRRLRRVGRVQEAKSAAWFASVSSVLLLDYVVFLLMTFGLWSYQTMIFVHSLCLNVVVFAEVIIFFNALPQHTSVLAKVVGTVLVLALSGISGLARFTFAEHERLLAERMRVDARALLLEPPVGEARLDYVYFAAAGQERTARLVHSRLPSELLPKFPKGDAIGLETRTVLASRDSTSPDRSFKVVMFRQDDRLVVAGIRFGRYVREFVQPIVTQFLLVLWGTYAFCLLVLPLFFRSNLVIPLTRLLEGVRRVDRGDYTSTVPVLFSDEIGHLTGAFNALVAVLRRHQEESGHAMQLIHDKQVEVERARFVAARARSAVVRRALQPHFVMNSLNTIVGLLREDPARAEMMVRSLAVELRSMLDVVHHRTIPASLELGLCEAHVQIMSFRLERPHLLETRGFTGHEQVPPFLFHTLVENAFTHRDSDEAIVLRLKCDDRPEETAFEFWSSTRSIGPSRDGTGTRFIRTALEETYPGLWKLETEEAGPGFSVRIRILHPAAEGEGNL